MNKLNKILDIVAALLALATVVGIIVGMVVHGGKPVGELPSWVLFLSVFTLIAFREKEKR